MVALGTPSVATRTDIGIAWGLRDSLVARYMNPGEVFVTRQGDFHWYVIHSTDPACIELWVHPCVPADPNNPSFAC
jgi:hypothetical protein